MPSNHLIFCHPLLLLPSIFPSIRVFSNELALLIRWPKYWSFRHDYEGKILLLGHRSIPNVLTAVLRWEPFSLHLGGWEGGKCVCAGDGRNSRTREPPPARRDLGSHHLQNARGTSPSWFAQDCHGIMGFPDGSVVKNPPAYIVLHLPSPLYCSFTDFAFSYFFLNNLFRLHWVSGAVCGLSLVAVSRGYSRVAVHRILTEVVSLVEQHGL